MSEVFYAMDYHTHLCEHVNRIQASGQERIAIAQSLIMWNMAKDKYGVDMFQSITLATNLRAPTESEYDAIYAEFDEYFKTQTGVIQTYEVAKSMYEREIASLMDAQTVFVSSEIMDEVAEAANTMPDNVLIPQDLFVSNGLLIFDKPYRLSLMVQNDLFTEEWDVHSVLFDITQDGMGINVNLYGGWRATTAHQADQRIEWNTQTKDFDIYGVENPEQVLDTLFSQKSEKLLPLRYRADNTHMLIDTTTYDFNTEGFYASALAGLKKHLIALFRMTNSYLEVERHRPPRHFTKRAKRAKRTIPEDFYLSVLTLRHHVSESNGGTHSSPKYAFRVRGHWAKRYLPSSGKPVGDPDAYRYVYIKDYIKGKDKQLVESTRVIRIAN